ncbi:hypothetical protein F2P81_017836 [Scophthalmus maximus]|uniref:Rho GTPase-activating protein 8 n=1 Tax=Scophthalmus maximus TaxID=52904 RepID=A0A6A4SCB7_SCOMX|nr:hypothetical protein F2P81_017836 [Scophthalmus maximus]
MMCCHLIDEVDVPYRRDFIHPPSQQEPEPRGFFTSTVSFFVFLRDSRVTVLDKYEESALMSTTVCSASNMVIKHNQTLLSVTLHCACAVPCRRSSAGVRKWFHFAFVHLRIVNVTHLGHSPVMTSVSDLEQLADIGDDLYGRKQIVFSSCCLPPSHQLNHRRLLEFLKFTLDQYVEMDYILVYFHHGLRSSNKPSLKWLREAYDEFDRKYKKNLKTLYVVHPTNFIRIVWNIFKPLISHKFGKKLKYVNFLDELRDHVNYEQLVVPADVLRHDEKLRAAQRGGASPLVKTPPPRPPLPSQQFGVSLQYIREKRREATIPLVLQQTVDYLKVKGLRTEGIFRRSARVQIIKDVQKLYNLGKPVNFDEFSDVHVPAVILKTFLRDLPEPLLTFRVYGQVQDVLSESRGGNIIILLKTNCSLMWMLSSDVESSLRVSRCRHIVSQQSIINKMSPSNLACVFGVNLVRPRHGSISLSDLTPINVFTELLVEHFAAVFGSRCPPGQVSQQSIINKMSPSNLACVFGVNLVRPRHGSISLSDLTPINVFTELLVEHFAAVFGSRCPPGQVRINMLHVASDADSDPDQDQNLIMILFVYEKAKLETSRSSWGRVSRP